ncbi:AP-2 complex subunit alpha-1 [Chelonoidis abingdonii]|uniref:AP-2 complex subunit alpha-1 n=1 Tax=Chelonoidis abingdonii TaxID=106734 RepID=UPI003F497091
MGASLSPLSLSVLGASISGKSKEAEIKRINKELANIRSKFKGDKALDGYSKKKYVCKLLFIFLLGHDIDFGHMEAVNLLSSNKYTEKQIVSVGGAGGLGVHLRGAAVGEGPVSLGGGVRRVLLSKSPSRTTWRAANPTCHVSWPFALPSCANVGSDEYGPMWLRSRGPVFCAYTSMDASKRCVPSASAASYRLARPGAMVRVDVPRGDLLNDPALGWFYGRRQLSSPASARRTCDLQRCVSLAVSRTGDQPAVTCAGRACGTLASSESLHEAVTPTSRRSSNALKTAGCTACGSVSDLLYAMFAIGTNAKQIRCPDASATGDGRLSIETWAPLTPLPLPPQALQAPACHENMVKVGGYILGEFGNLIAGDPRSSPLVQFNLLHSKFHLCSVATRALLLSTYIKFINLFPETKGTIQEVLRSDSQIRNADVELQQRAVEYLKLSSIASTDVLATVLEEMPPFPERESSILAKLKRKKGPGAGSELDEGKKEPGAELNGGVEPTASTTSTPSPSADLLGLRTAPPASSAAPTSAGNLLVDVFSDNTSATPGLAPGTEDNFLSSGTAASSDDPALPISEADELLNKMPSAPRADHTSIQSTKRPSDTAAQTLYLSPHCGSGVGGTHDLIPPPPHRPQQEAQKIFKANHPMDSEVTKAKLLGFGCALLDKVDPNPDNYVGAGIIQTKSLQVGCLLRLEPNAQAQMYRLTLRTSREPVSRHLCGLLAEQF